MSILTSTAKAFDTIGYDAGFLSPDEGLLLKKQGVTPPFWQKTEAQAPFTIATTTEGDRIGFLRFPPLNDKAEGPPREIMDRLSQDIEKYRQTVRLLVGMSDWGWLGEQEYLSAKPKYVPDILLGSNRGSGVNGRIKADGRCLWVRAYDKGRSIVEITIFEWPDRKNSFAWNPATNYKTKSIGLNDQIKDNAAVNAVLK